MNKDKLPIGAKQGTQKVKQTNRQLDKQTLDESKNKNHAEIQRDRKIWKSLQ